MTGIGRYRKTLAALIGALITWASATLTDNHVSTAEWIALALAITTALGVYAAPNEPLDGDDAGD